MFDLGRELKRFFASERFTSERFASERGAPSREGLTRGDATLLELLDANLLAQEAKAADVAAGRIGAKDKSRLRLDAAIVWRELARRTGDAVALRKAAALAETAAAGLESERHGETWARARCEQAFCALLGAEIFGDPGLNAAAEAAFREARSAARGGLAAPLADVGLAAIAARTDLETAEAAKIRSLAERFAAPIAALDSMAKRITAARSLAAEARLLRADLLCAAGARLRDPDLLDMAAKDAAVASGKLDAAYEPLTWARARVAHGQALALRGECMGDLDALAAGAGVLANAIDQLTRDHSPMDWARTQVALAQTLQALGEASGEVRAFEHAISSYDRANLVLKETPTLPLRGLAASARAVCLARTAELTSDLAVLDSAEAAMKIELARMSPRRDPVGWGISQLHLARLYEARMGLRARDQGERAAGLLALEAALDVFAEHGQRSLSILATEAIARLREPATTPER